VHDPTLLFEKGLMSESRIAALVDFAASHQTKALIIQVHGKVVAEHYWDGRKAADVSDVFSVAKSVVSLLVGIAVTNGVISLDDYVSESIGNMRWTREADASFEQTITVRHLLTMTSGLDDFMRAKAPPGSRWHYNLGTAWHILKSVLEHAYSSTIDKIARQQLFTKVGASTAHFRHQNTNPMQLFAGGSGTKNGSDGSGGGGGSISSAAAMAILGTVLKQFIPAILPSSLLYGALAGTFVAGLQSYRASRRRWGSICMAGCGSAMTAFVFQLGSALASAYKARKMPNGRPTDTLYMSARDLCAIGTLILHRGRLHIPSGVAGSAATRGGRGGCLDPIEEPLLSEEYLDAMLRPSQSLNPSYGYLWWLNGQTTSRSEMLPFAEGEPPLTPGPLNRQAPADMVAALGFGDQKLYVCPSMGIVAVRLGESAAGEGGPASATASPFDERLWELLMRAVSPPPPLMKAAGAPATMAGIGVGVADPTAVPVEGAGGFGEGREGQNTDIPSKL
jgi:CubicO group peptidase (beta-lactamase class C family)